MSSLLSVRRTRAGAKPLGPDFRRLWLANAVSQVGDGVTVVATPLLVADLTHDPGLVAGAAFVTQLPWLIFALVSGAYADRWDRRRVITTVNVLRGLILAGLAVAITAGAVTIPLLYAAGILLGTLETLADSASGAVLPAIVAGDQLERANAWLAAPSVIGNQMIAKPLGAYLFVVGAAIPFGFDAATFLIAAAFVAGIRRPTWPVHVDAVERDLRKEIGEGIRGLRERPPLRNMALCLCAGNILFCAAFATFVLYARDRLGLSDVGFGTLLAVWSVGGLLGTVLAAPLRARFGPGTVLRAGLVIEASTHVVLALTRTPIVAGAILVLFGIHAMVWGILIASLRQRLVPDRLQGRVGSVFALLSSGGAALGTLAGGILARATDLVTPFWAAGIGTAVVTAVVWRPFSNEALRVP